MRLSLLLPILFLSALAACSPAAVATSPPSAVADKTLLDERIALGIESAYGAARTVAEVAVDSGQIRGATATRVAKLDRDAYRAVAVMRAAYATGNASSYLTAAATATRAVQAYLSGTRGDGP